MALSCVFSYNCDLCCVAKTWVLRFVEPSPAEPTNFAAVCRFLSATDIQQRSHGSFSATFGRFAFAEHEHHATLQALSLLVPPWLKCGKHDRAVSPRPCWKCFAFAAQW